MPMQSQKHCKTLAERLGNGFWLVHELNQPGCSKVFSSRPAFGFEGTSAGFDDSGFSEQAECSICFSL